MDDTMVEAVDDAFWLALALDDGLEAVLERTLGDLIG
jgi:hypothetical protein